QIDLTKLRDMIGSLHGANKTALSSDGLLSDLRAAGVIANQDSLVFKSDLGEEISKHSHGVADSAEISHQLHAVYAQLRAEFQAANLENAAAVTHDATAMSHDTGDHLHLHNLHGV